MSTRSGKRIHSTAFEIGDSVDLEVVPKSERKTRNKRLKENEDQQEISVPKSKTQKHYVGYPATDDEGGYATASDALDSAKSTRKAKKNTLKEHDTNVLETKNVDENVGDKKNARVTRRTRRFAENVEDDTQDDQTEAPAETLTNNKHKGKKNKNKNLRNSNINENIPEPVQVEEPKVVTKKSKKKKKKGKHANSSTEEVKKSLNRSNVSTDSFHSAAGSPVNVTENKQADKTPEHERNDKTLVKEDLEPGTRRRKSSIKVMTPVQLEVEQELDDTLKNDSKKKRKSSIKNTTFEKEVVSDTTENLNSTYDKMEVEPTDKLKKVGKEPKARRSLRLTIENSDTSNIEVPKKLNTTFERETKSKNSLQLNNAENGNDDSNKLNTTFEKSSNKSQSRVISLDSTFDKSNPKLNSTFDKIETKLNSEKSSLVTSDESVNRTFDKDNSRVSITSDDSKTENIVNTTPLLIESSMDESHHSISKTPENLNVTKDLISPTPKESLQVPITPLKREGTFTKESPEVKASNKTPTKRLTLPSPGMTPFHITRSSNKEKSVMNVTRSIEKSRRSSFADLAPSRQTRVMFCSPVNNPALVMQQKKKVIKSSMKGSNKSFVYDESASAVVKPASRKRSYTHNDAEETRVKRTRLTDDLQNSVNRLSRPRTSSAAAKLPDTTPSKKGPTPVKPKSEPKRTKLPNFAALHQKQFDKMESLDECQRRKLRRAKKLMIPKTPNGTVQVLERSSPRGLAEQKLKEASAKTQESPVKKPVTPAKKLVTPAKKTDTPTKAEQTSKLSKLPTLESLRPGFTRFGFKMNTDFNPFSIPSKTDAKPTTNTEKQNGVVRPNIEKAKGPAKSNPEKPNGLTAKPNMAAKTPTVKPLSRLPTLPSTAGFTTMRKEAAKQAVMREKSFTSLSGKRDAKRNESRTIIKGVRTNRRFELQMQMRNID